MFPPKLIVLCLLSFFIAVLNFSAYAQKTFYTLDIEVRSAEGRSLQNTFLKIESKETKQEVLRKDGKFTIHLPKSGIYELWAGGVNHGSINFPLFIEDPGQTAIEIQLSSAPYLERIDSVFVTGDFNNFSVDKDIIAMERKENGLYQATIAVASDTLAYQLLGIHEGWNPKQIPMEGIRADFFSYNSSGRNIIHTAGKFISVVKVKEGKAEVVFDPNNLPRSNQSAVVRFSNHDSRLAKIATIALDFNQRMILRYQSHLNNRKRGGDASTALKEDKAKYHAAYVQFLQQEQDPLVRQYIMRKYLELLDFDVKPELARQFLTEVSPASKIWLIQPDQSSYAFNWLSQSLGHPKKADEYVHQLINSHSDSDLIASFLQFGLERAFTTGNLERVKIYYDRLINEFPDTKYAINAKKDFDPDTKFKKGNPVPDFTLTDLDNKSFIYTPASLKGKVYLIDFWATYCGPCISAMPELKKIHDKYWNKGFVILSISLDERKDKVDAFRKRFTMPWPNALLTEGFEHPVSKTFLVTALPRDVLVGSDGIIIANDADLKREGLNKILSGLFVEGK